MKPSIKMDERELNREVARITMKIAKLMTPCDHGMTGSVISNLLAMYLWTHPPAAREKLTAAVIKCANALLKEVPPEAPPSVRAPRPDA
jgi:hypothetical protein